MVNALLVVFIVVVIAVYILLKIFFKGIFKVVSIIWSVLALGMLVFGGFLFADANQMMSRFQSEQNTFVFDVDGDIVAGFSSTTGQEPVFLEDLAAIDQYYDAGDLDAILGDSYKLLVIKEGALANVNNIELSKYNIDRETALAWIKSDNPKDQFVDLVMVEEAYDESLRPQVVEQLSESLGTDEQFKALLFANMFSIALQGGQPSILIDKIREKDIAMYPESLVIKTVRFLPSFVIDQVVK